MLWSNQLHGILEPLSVTADDTLRCCVPSGECRVFSQKMLSCNGLYTSHGHEVGSRFTGRTSDTALEIVLRMGSLGSHVSIRSIRPGETGVWGSQDAGFPTEVTVSVLCFSLMPPTHEVWETRTRQRSLVLGSTRSVC